MTAVAPGPVAGDTTAMSANGTTRKNKRARFMSASPLKAAVMKLHLNFRDVPKGEVRRPRGGDCCMQNRSVAERKNALLTGALGQRG